MKIFEINAGNYKDPQNMDLLLQVIDIQKENYLQNESPQKSFLLTIWSDEELLSLVSRGSSFYVATSNRELVGYIVISSLVDFLKQLDEANNHNFDSARLNNSKPWSYLYQIAVRKSFQGRNVSKALFSEVKRLRPESSFVSDYLINPLINIGSSRMFERLGFEKSGEMVLENYRGVECTKWQIVILE